MKFVILADTHAGARNASDPFLEYFGRFWSEVFFPFCHEQGIKHILHAGDFFDQRKTVNFKALYHNRKHFLEPLVEAGMTMDIIPGNHDVAYKNTNRLCSLKELLGYFIKNINIVMEPRVIDYEGCPIALLPWINAENYDASMQFIANAPASILAAHLELEGFDVMKGVAAHHGMSAKLFERFETVWSGHYHTRQTKGNVSYLGTPFEITWADCDDPKYFHVFDTDTRTITPIRNPLTLFRKIYYDDSKTDYLTDFDVTTCDAHFVKIIVVTKTDHYRFDKFVEKVQNRPIHDLKIIESYDEFVGTQVEDDNISMTDTPELLNSYVDATVTDLDKGQIKTELRGLYNEALEREFAS